jgi:hypothetical protein
MSGILLTFLYGIVTILVLVLYFYLSGRFVVLKIPLFEDWDETYEGDNLFEHCFITTCLSVTAHFLLFVFLISIFMIGNIVMCAIN